MGKKNKPERRIGKARGTGTEFWNVVGTVFSERVMFEDEGAIVHTMEKDAYQAQSRSCWGSWENSPKVLQEQKQCSGLECRVMD